jgi:hypothetical protein
VSSIAHVRAQKTSFLLCDDRLVFAEDLSAKNDGCVPLNMFSNSASYQHIFRVRWPNGKSRLNLKKAVDHKKEDTATRHIALFFAP